MARKLVADDVARLDTGLDTMRIGVAVPEELQQEAPARPPDRTPARAGA